MLKTRVVAVGQHQAAGRDRVGRTGEEAEDRVGEMKELMSAPQPAGAVAADVAVARPTGSTCRR